MNEGNEMRATAKQHRAVETIAHAYPHYAGRHNVTREHMARDDFPVRAILSDFHSYIEPLCGRKYWTVEAVATAALHETGSVQGAFLALEPIIGTDYLKFSANVDGSRVAKPMDAQREECWKLLRRIARHGNSATGKGTAPENPSTDALPPVVPAVVPAYDIPDEPVIPAEIRVVTAGDNPAYLLRRINEIREYCESRKADGSPLDDIGLRPYKNAAKMWKAGISTNAALHALTLTYPQDARSALGITDVDVTRMAPVARTFDGDIPETSAGATHAALPYVRALVSARIPVMLIGGKGTGKTTLCQNLADEMFPGADAYASISCNAGLPMSAIYGRQLPLEGKVIPSALTLAVKNGGVFLFDEIDASDANTNLAINELLANRTMTNPITGEVIRAHDNFVPMSAANTTGLGSDKKFTGREKLDAAALDRWAAGRVKIDFDVKLAEHIFWMEIAA